MTDKNGWSSTDKGSLQQGCWFPATGKRSNSSGDLDIVVTHGRAWQAIPKSPNYARVLNSANNYVDPVSNLARSEGAFVRPVEEIEEKN